MQMDYIIVPTKSPHTFLNLYKTEAKMFFICSPAFYVNYFKMLSEMIKDREPLTPELNVKAMTYFATLPVAEPWIASRKGILQDHNRILNKPPREYGLFFEFQLYPSFSYIEFNSSQYWLSCDS